MRKEKANRLKRLGEFEKYCEVCGDRLKLVRIRCRTCSEKCRQILKGSKCSATKIKITPEEQALKKSNGKLYRRNRRFDARNTEIDAHKEVVNRQRVRVKERKSRVKKKAEVRAREVKKAAVVQAKRRHDRAIEKLFDGIV